MDNNTYKKLAQALDLLPGGFPQTKSGVELQILKKIFTPKEALIASKMGRTRETVDTIAKRANLPKEETTKRLKTMLSKGVIWGSQRAGIWTFRLAPYIVGIWEEQCNTMDHELAHLCEQYWNEGGAEGIMRPEPALHRVIPAQHTLKTETILPYDDVKKLILQAKSFELIDCVCRKQKDLVGNRECNFPLRVCLTFTSREIPIGSQSITQKEALDMIDQSEEMGLVHTVSNIVNGISYVCNCCSCCCAVLGGITKFGIDNSVARANYYAVVDPEECAACGTCVDRCQVNATSVDDLAIIDLTKCIGCGLCVTGCPNKAVMLRLRPEAEIITPPDNYKTWEDQRLRNRGLLR